MNRPVQAGRLLALILAAGLAATSSAWGQDTTAAGVAKTIELRADTTRFDSSETLPPFIYPAVPPGPLPPGTRYSFTRDSILWMRGLTLGDLLTSIPGVYVARAGYLGQPEYVAYAGRGGSAVELYWDGLPLAPLGPDSLFHDVGRINLTYVDRVDVEVLPSTIRVYLVSSRHDELRPRSALRIMAGDYRTGAYAGLFQKRWPQGVGVNLAADFVGTDGASGQGRSDQTFDLWARLDWQPGTSSGASYQIRRQNHNRDPVPAGSQDPDVPARHGDRTDVAFMMYVGSRPDALGPRAEAGVAASSWTSDSVVGDQRVRQAYVTAGYRRPRWTAEVTGRLGDARVFSGVEGRLGLVPLAGVVVSGDARWERHPLDRTSLSANGSVGLYAGPLSLVGTMQFADAVQAPAIADDTTQRTVDRLIRLGLRTQPVSGHVALVRRDTYRPLAYPELALIASLDSSEAATYLVADARLASSRALALEAWYSTPVRGGPADLQPPKHLRAQITLRSRFWRTFRSGAFDFKLQLAMESWSTGNAGIDRSGVPITLTGATFYEAFLQFKLADFAGFWHFMNAYNSPDPYVPGLTYPRSVQAFGVKWEFRS